MDSLSPCKSPCSVKEKGGRHLNWSRFWSLLLLLLKFESLVLCVSSWQQSYYDTTVSCSAKTQYRLDCWPLKSRPPAWCRITRFLLTTSERHTFVPYEQREEATARSRDAEDWSGSVVMVPLPMRKIGFVSSLIISNTEYFKWFNSHCVRILTSGLEFVWEWRALSLCWCRLVLQLLIKCVQSSVWDTVTLAVIFTVMFVFLLLIMQYALLYVGQRSITFGLSWIMNKHQRLVLSGVLNWLGNTIQVWPCLCSSTLFILCFNVFWYEKFCLGVLLKPNHLYSAFYLLVLGSYRAS